MASFVIELRQGTVSKEGKDYSNTFFLEAKAEGAFRAIAAESCEGRPGVGDLAAMLADLKTALSNRLTSATGALKAIDTLPAGNAGVGAILKAFESEASKPPKAQKPRRVATGK